jgi:hypothetical protein
MRIICGQADHALHRHFSPWRRVWAEQRSPRVFAASGKKWRVKCSRTCVAREFMRGAFLIGVIQGAGTHQRLPLPRGEVEGDKRQLIIMFFARTLRRVRLNDNCMLY